jgi:uncharacterized membrane protein YphA (DoxX/SURF4 family)
MTISPTKTLEWIYAVFIALFAYTGCSKLSHLHGFEMVLNQSPLLHAFAGLLAWVVPIIELMIVALLLLPTMRLIGLVSAFLLLLLLTAYLLYMLVFMPNLPCSCGGILSALSWPQHVFLNLLLMVVAWLGFWLSITSQRSKVNNIKK